MKKLTLILFLALAKIGYAQQDTTLVYSSPMYTKDPVRSKWKPVVKHAGEFYQVSFYDKKEIIQEVISFEDKELTIRKGPYTAYQKGKLKESGTFDKGHRNGLWTTYNTTSEKIKKTENFAHGKLDGKTSEYWEDESVQTEGTYENGRKIGEWKLFFKDGKLAGKEIYDVYGKKGEAEYFFNDGKPAKYEDLFTKPSFYGGMQAFYRYLSSEMKYPKEAAKNKISGVVYVSFTVKKDGSLEDVEATKSPDFDLSNEAIRVVEKSPKWLPGKKFGETVDVKYNIPIKFTL